VHFWSHQSSEMQIGDHALFKSPVDNRQVKSTVRLKAKAFVV
jgi:hypothetical protein